MPLYTYRCENDHRAETYHPVKLLGAYLMLCDECGKTMSETVIQAPLLVKVAQDVCYDSPVTGAPITSWAAREEDLKRNNCRPYDPDAKTDHANRIKDSEAALDRTVDASVEEAIEKMPTAKRGKLFSELVNQGVQADVIRSTPHA
jgi:predicted nucleic acid-binding Zn ribbon protein